MSDPTAFQGAPGGSRRGPARAALVAVLAIVFVGVAIAKPWGDGGGDAAARASSPPSSAPSRAGTRAPEPSAAGPLGGFVLDAPAGDRPWTRITWRRSAAGDPLRLVRSVVSWRDGYVAVGYDPADPTMPTPAWSSTDGRTWELVPVNTPETFWPGIQIAAVAETRTGLVALTSPGTDCRGYQLCEYAGPPVTAWASTDGRTWRPAAAPSLGTAETWRGVALAGGRRGTVAVSLGLYAEVATSPDGVTWTASPPGSVPSDVAYGVIEGTSSGFVLAGIEGSSWTTNPTRGPDVTGPGVVWSVDGREWQAATVTGGGDAGSGVGSPSPSPIEGPALPALAVGQGGVVVRLLSTVDPSLDRWWRSDDGRTWEPLQDPSGADGGGVGAAASVGMAGDGRRIVVVRGGSDGGTWVSTDGSSWTPLEADGSLPVGQPNEVVVLPGGILVSDGTTTWYGTASSG